MPRPSTLSLELLQTFLVLLRDDGDAAVTTRELDINQPSMSKRLSIFQHAGPKNVVRGVYARCPCVDDAG